MDRRETLKTLLVGSMAGGIAGATTLQGCRPNIDESLTEIADDQLYGRTPEELTRDATLLNQEFLTAEELSTMAVLCDIILPATNDAVSATDAGVVEFVDFIVKDIPSHQVPMRGGLMWLNSEANRRFGLNFEKCSDKEQIAIIEDIAYPDDADPAHSHGVKFFTLMRNLVLTGYYTSRMGLRALGYQGNVANVWDGVPQEVLDKHGLSYEDEWLAKCIDQSTRNEVAQWDDEGNLIN